jgi:hypothetical protein
MQGVIAQRKLDPSKALGSGVRKNLATDYDRMSPMIFGTPPAFDDVMASIEALEQHLYAAPA